MSMIAPVKLDLIDELAIYQNASHILLFTVEDSTNTPIDITGYAIDADFKTADTANTLVDEWTCTITGAAAGEFSCTLTPAETLLLPVGRYLWDLRLAAPGGTAYYYAQGVVDVLKTETR